MCVVHVHALVASLGVAEPANANNPIVFFDLSVGDKNAGTRSEAVKSASEVCWSGRQCGGKVCD